MNKNLYLLLIVLILAACGKQVVDTNKEAISVRDIVSKISGGRINIPGANANDTTKTGKDSDVLAFETTGFVYSLEGRKDPFYSLLTEKEKLKMELEEKKKKEEEEKKKFELAINITQEEWGKVEIAAILGDGKGYLVLFIGDDTIYQKNDYIGKDKKIKITEIDKNSVNLTMGKGDKVLNKRIIVKTESR